MRHLHRPDSSSPFVAAIDPRVRLLGGAVLLVLVVSSGGVAFPATVLAFCLPVALLSGMRLRILCLRMLHPLFIALVILALKALAGQHATDVLRPGGWPLLQWGAGLQGGVQSASRIMGAAAIALTLTQLLTFTETMAALAWLRIPRGLVEVSLFAWRSLFMLYDDAAVVYTAQKNRLGYCGFRRSLRSFGTMAGMLTIRAFDSSHSLTTAMTLRGYDGQLPLLRAAGPSLLQLVGLALFALAAGLAWNLQN